MRVGAPLAVAFEVFIGQQWWPVETHHLAGVPGSVVVLEPFPAGRWYERAPDGTQTDWGTVLAWQPPYRLLLTWQVSPQWTYEADPGRGSRASRCPPSRASAQTYRYPADGPAEHVELLLGPVTVAISHRAAARAQGLPAPTAGHPLELVVWCESADEAVASLRSAGTPVLVEPYSHAAGHRRAYVADPDGNWIALVSKSV